MPRKKTTASSASVVPASSQPSADPRLVPLSSADPLDESEFLLAASLPGVDDLSADVRALVEQSTQDLLAGRYQAAIDACLMACASDSSFLPIVIRLGELNLKLGRRRLARAHATTALRLCETSRRLDCRWMIYRLLVHAGEETVPNLYELVDLLFEMGEPVQATFYATRLLRRLDSDGRMHDAIAVAGRIRTHFPSDARIVLEEVLLRLRAGESGSVLDLWESAMAAGASPVVAKASLVAIDELGERERWRLLAEVAESLRKHVEPMALEAFERTSDAVGVSAEARAGSGVLLAACGEKRGGIVLETCLADPSLPSFPRAVACALLIHTRLTQDGQLSNRQLVESAVSLFRQPEIASFEYWHELLGFEVDAASFNDDLAGLLLEVDEVDAAIQVIDAALVLYPGQWRLTRRLASAHGKKGNLKRALSLLDGLAAKLKAAGQLEEMAAVLRQMSELAPDNLKVKSRLIDIYLQRGFVAEARAELLQRAEIEERSGLNLEAARTLARAAGVSWGSGDTEEAFELFERLFAIAPDAVEHRHTAVAYYLQDHRTAEAARHQRAIVEIAFRAGRRHEAVAALHQVIGLTPDDASAYLQLGELLGSLGEYAQAERVYRRLLLVTPDDPFARAKATAMATLREQHEGRAFAAEAAS